MPESGVMDMGEGLVKNGRFSELRCKEVINICDGSRLGYVFDLALDLVCGKITAIIIPGPAKFCGMFGHGEEFVVPWEKIVRIGEDIILIDIEHIEICDTKHHKKRVF
jgi:YlmC/YmxH family sporulation protein